MFGRLSVLPYALRTEPTPQYKYEDYVAELKGRLKTAHQVPKDNLIGSKARSKVHYDKNAEMKADARDKVLLFDETVRRDRPKKLSSQWIGLYTVVEVEKVTLSMRTRESYLPEMQFDTRPNVLWQNCLNSMWGKLTERNNRTKSKLISDPQELYRFLATPGIEVMNLIC
jgi:hypothetical protein